MTAKTAEDRLRYAKQYYSVLQHGSHVEDLLQLSPNKRIHVMKSLSCLARFTGNMPAWKAIIEQYQLSWCTGTEKIDAFQRFFSDEITLDAMIGWLREALYQLPRRLGNVFLFAALSGMRITECLASIKLIADSARIERYYDSKNHVLRHYLFPSTFIRRTKSLYVSVVNDEILEIAREIDRIPALNTLKMASRRRNLSMKLKYTRKIHGSYLRQKGGIEAEIIDLLQGRVPKSVFARHYFTPNSDYREKVLAAEIKLMKEIEE